MIQLFPANEAGASVIPAMTEKLNVLYGHSVVVGTGERDAQGVTCALNDLGSPVVAGRSHHMFVREGRRGIRVTVTVCCGHPSDADRALQRQEPGPLTVRGEDT